MIISGRVNALPPETSIAPGFYPTISDTQLRVYDGPAGVFDEQETIQDIFQGVLAGGDSSGG